MNEGSEFTVNDRRRISNPDAGDAQTRDGAKQDAGKTRPQTPTPPITFSTFVLSLSTSAAMNMGGYQDPVSGYMPKNLELAKQSIDILGILKDKTVGNLDAGEEKLLESALYELRMQYIAEMKKG
jgi:hypothetical protein